MTPVEIIALIFIALSVIKLITLLISPKKWYGPSNPMVKLVWNEISATLFSLLLGGVVLFYLLKEIDIVQVFVAVVFTFLLFILTMAPDIRKVLEVISRHLERKTLLPRYWFPFLVWVVFMAYVAWEILA